MSAMRDNGLTILVTGIVRNVASTIERDVIIIERALRNFHSIKWFLVESDSTDETIDKLTSLSSRNENFKFTTLGQIQKAEDPRTVAMARARNRYLAEIRENTEYGGVDLIAISDFNGLNNKLTETNKIKDKDNNKNPSKTTNQ